MEFSNKLKIGLASTFRSETTSSSRFKPMRMIPIGLVNIVTSLRRVRDLSVNTCALVAP